MSVSIPLLKNGRSSVFGGDLAGRPTVMDVAGSTRSRNRMISRGAKKEILNVAEGPTGMWRGCCH